MRVNVYAEEMTNRIEIITKTTPDGEFTGLRFYLELPCTIPGESVILDGCMGEQRVDRPARNVRGPFMHHPGDDDSAAVTFWGKQDLRQVLRLALDKLDSYYEKKS